MRTMLVEAERKVAFNVDTDAKIGPETSIFRRSTSIRSRTGCQMLKVWRFEKFLKL